MEEMEDSISEADSEQSNQSFLHAPPPPDSGGEGPEPHVLR